MHPKQWRKCLLEVDDSILSANDMQQLRNALPSQDVLKKLNEISATKFDDMPEGEKVIHLLNHLR